MYLWWNFLGCLVLVKIRGVKVGKDEMEWKLEGGVFVTYGRGLNVLKIMWDPWASTFILNWEKKGESK